MAHTARQQRGQRSEQLAVCFLRSAGYQIKETNVRFPVGEIDIVAREGNTLCFVEVRATSSSQWGGPLASIDARKRHRLLQAARWYLARLRQLPLEIRFDVVAITWDTPDRPSVELIQAAFTNDDGWTSGRGRRWM